MGSNLAKVIAIVGSASATGSHGLRSPDWQSQESALVELSISSPESRRAIELQRNHAHLVDKVRELAQQTNFNGGLVLTEGGTSVVSELFGNAKSSTAMRFDLCSVTKSVVALGVLHLIDSTHLELDTKLSQIKFKELVVPADKANITVRQLLNHTSGLSEESMILGVNPATIEALNKLLQLPRNSNRPESQFTYSNTNYFVLAQVVEAFSDTTFQDYMQNSVGPKLGIDKLTFRHEINHPELNTMPLGYTAQGATGIVVNLTEGGSLLNAISTHLDKAISADSWSAFINEGNSGYGCGVYVAKASSGERIIYHSGADSAGSSSFLISNLDSGRAALVVGHRELVGGEVIRAVENPAFLSAITDFVCSPSPIAQAPVDNPHGSKLVGTELTQIESFSAETEHGVISMSMSQGPNGTLELAIGGPGALQLCRNGWSPNNDFDKFTQALLAPLSQPGAVSIDRRLARFLSLGFMPRTEETRVFMSAERQTTPSVFTTLSPFEGRYVYSLIGYPESDDVLVLAYPSDKMASLVDGRSTTAAIDLSWLVSRNTKWLQGYLAPSPLTSGNEWVGSLAITGTILPRPKHSTIPALPCPPTYLEFPTIRVDSAAAGLELKFTQFDGSQSSFHFKPNLKARQESTR